MTIVCLPMSPSMSGGTISRVSVIVVGIARQQHVKAILDRDAGRDDQEGAREAVGSWRVRDGVERLPGDDHRHDGGLARARRHLQGQAEELGVGLGIRWPGSRSRWACCRLGRATSVSQISVSTASIWQKKSGSSRPALCRCLSSVSVS